MKSPSAIVLVFLARALSSAALAVSFPCPKGVPVVNCFLDPCQFSNPCVRGATCVSDYCGGCRARCVCNYNGDTYHAGVSFPARDGCNRCICSKAGSVDCTDSTCIRCQYNGQKYKPGDIFSSTDGCNKCSCGKTGSVQCTEIACIPCSYNSQIYKPGDSFPAVDGCNNCSCTQYGSVRCTQTGCNCPVDAPFVACKADPCAVSTGCRSYPLAECRSNYCGGCNAEYYVQSQKVNCSVCPNNKQVLTCTNNCHFYRGYKHCVPDFCSGPKCSLKLLKRCKDGSRPVQCFADPCLLTLCPGGHTCVSNYCGGCKADCVPATKG